MWLLCKYRPHLNVRQTRTAGKSEGKWGQIPNQQAVLKPRGSVVLFGGEDSPLLGRSQLCNMKDVE